MLVYFDTEFTGLRKDTTLVSIGLVDQNGETFYAELTDWDKSWLEKDHWFKEHVYDNLLMTHGIESDADISVLGTKEEVRDALKKWLSQYIEVQLVSDVCHYDMVLFIDLFGSAFDLPSNVFASCHDINQDIAIWGKDDWTNGVYEESSAFDFNREDFLSSYLMTNVPEGRKHNALFDAKVIREIHEVMMKFM